MEGGMEGKRWEEWREGGEEGEMEEGVVGRREG